MKGNIILDTGPLVAFLDRRDRWHAWAKAQMAEITPPLLTCESVVSESCFLLRDLPGGVQAVMRLWEQGVFTVDFVLNDHRESIEKLLSRYSNVPMSLADACLVRMSEVTGGSEVCTLDSGFRIYRRHGRQVIPLLFP